MVLIVYFGLGLGLWCGSCELIFGFCLLWFAWCFAMFYVVCVICELVLWDVLYIYGFSVFSVFCVLYFGFVCGLVVFGLCWWFPVLLIWGF